MIEDPHPMRISTQLCTLSLTSIGSGYCHLQQSRLVGLEDKQRYQNADTEQACQTGKSCKALLALGQQYGL